MLTGLRGVGKTVLLNTLRSAAVRRGWGTGKLEARPDSRCAVRSPPRCTWPSASCRAARRRRPTRCSAWSRRSRCAPAPGGTGPRKLRDRWQPGIDVPAAVGRADSGDIEIDLVELLTDVAGLAADAGKGVAIFIDEMQDLMPDDVSALCAACHELSQQGLPLIVVGAGLPHLPAVLSASKSYSERLFRYTRIDRLDRDAADRALVAPAAGRGRRLRRRTRSTRSTSATDGYPYFVQAYGKVAWDVAPRVADHRRRRRRRRARGRGRAGGRVLRVAVRAGHARPSASTCARWPTSGSTVGDGPVPTAEVAKALGRKPQSLSPARDALLKKGLVWSGERGQIAFTVPHFGRYLRASAPD